MAWGLPATTITDRRWSLCAIRLMNRASPCVVSGLGEKHVILVVTSIGHRRPVEIASNGASPALNSLSPSATRRMSSAVFEPKTTMAPALRGALVCGQMNSFAVSARKITKAANTIQKTRDLVRTPENISQPSRVPAPRRCPPVRGVPVRPSHSEWEHGERMNLALYRWRIERLPVGHDNATLGSWKKGKEQQVQSQLDDGGRRPWSSPWHW